GDVRSGLDASLAKLAVSNCSLRSPRCSPEAATFVGSDGTIGSANQLCSRGVSSAPPAARRREHRKPGSRFVAAYFVVVRDQKHLASLLLSTATRDLVPTGRSVSLAGQPGTAVALDRRPTSGSPRRPPLCCVLLRAR